MNKLSIVIKHFNTVNKHRYWVFRYCCKVGIPFQGLIHDLSKYSPTEFFESVNYYTGTHSPIDECKKQNNGISYAWLHHKGRNKHHYEYWQDNFDNGTTHLQMPYKYVLEMLCDNIGASHAYLGSNFSYEMLYGWWRMKIDNPVAMDDVTKQFLEICFSLLAKDNVSEKVVLNKDNLKELYNLASNEVERQEFEKEYLKQDEHSDL